MAKYFMVAGEASGDLHGAGLTEALLQSDPQAEVCAWGGDEMSKARAKVVAHYRQLSVMGFTEVIKALPRILRLMRKCKADIQAFQPDVLILIDYPGFNMRLATWAKKNGFRVCYYISPKVWAWNTGRVYKIKRDVDLMLCILPFEVDFYRKYDVKVEYIGNPLLDNVSAFVPDPNFKQANQLPSEKPILAILPGSRKQELTFILQPMLEAAAQRPEYQAVVACAPSLSDEMYAPYKAAFPQVKWVREATYDLLHVAKVGLICSGTATLETALLQLPQVVCYRGQWLSAFIAKRVIQVPYISLVNLIANKLLVPELIQEKMTPETILQELDALSAGPAAEKQMTGYQALRTQMGEPGVRTRAAKAIAAFLKAETHEAN